MPVIESTLTIIAVILVLAVTSSKLTRRFGIPILLIFLGIGMLAGSEGIGGIEFTDHRLAQNVGVAALAVILFAGGLDTNAERVRSVVVPALSLATFGVLITSVIVGLAAHLVLDVPVMTGLLLGAVVSSTDAAAVFAVMRSQRVGLRGDLQPVLELESGSNDPMAVFLTVGLLAMITDPDKAVTDLLVLFVQQMLIGAVLGYALAKAAVWLINRIRLEDGGLYPVLSLGMALLIFGATASLGGSGFLAVYVAGIVVGNARLVHRHSLIQFHDAIAWLAQIAMFLVLGLLVFPSDLLAVALDGLVLAAVLVLVARPVATFVALPTRRFTLRGKAFISWVGLRGAVPIILATFALAENIEGAQLIFDLVFFVVIVSVLLQGTTLAPAARALGKATPLLTRAPSPINYSPVDNVSDIEMREFVVSDDSPAVGAQLAEVDLPEAALMLLVFRGGEHVIPTGSTILEAGDRALMLAPEPMRPAIQEVLGAPPERS